MKVTVTAETKSLGDAKPGELVQIMVPPTGQRIIAKCIVLETGDKGPSLGCLHAIKDTSDRPFHFQRPNNATCLSFGMDWVLRPKLGEESYPVNRHFISKPGALHLIGSEWFANFGAPDESMQDDAHYNLTESRFQDATLAQGATPFLEWSIYLSDDHYETFPEEPYITIRASDA
jgi:hypothetical protein